MIGNTPDDNNILDTEVAVPLKYLSNFWSSLDLPLINCEIELDLSWSKEFIISEILITPAQPGNPNANPPITDVAAIQTTRPTFEINNAKLYVWVVTLSINDNIRILESIKQGLKRTISWNKYRSEIRTQPKNKNLHYLIYHTFGNTSRLFVLSFKNDDGTTKDSFDNYYMTLVEIKDFKVLIVNQTFFDYPVTNK